MRQSYHVTLTRIIEPVALSKYAAEYEQMLKWMVEFLIKFQGRGIKIDS